MNFKTTQGSSQPPEVYGLCLNYYGDTVQQSILPVEIKLHTSRTYSRLAAAFTLCCLHASLTVRNKSGEMGAKQQLGSTEDSQQSQGIGTNWCQMLGKPLDTQGHGKQDHGQE